MSLLKQETWHDFYPDCLLLFREHNDEIGESAEHMPLDPDIQRCEALDKAGMLQITSARSDDNQLLGYCVFFIGNSLSSKDVLCGTQSLFFVTKAGRSGGLGIKLYLEAIKQMRVRGVKNIYPHHWLKGDSPKLRKFFLSLGAEEIEHEYSLWIGE